MQRSVGPFGGNESATALECSSQPSVLGLLSPSQEEAKKERSRVWIQTSVPATSWLGGLGQVNLPEALL